MKKTFKKALAVLLVAVMVFGSAPLAGFVGIELPEFNLLGTKADAATSGYFTYSVSNNQATITDVSTSISGSVTIPATLGGYPVTSIGKYAFKECTGLTSVTIPDSVTSIDYFAFGNCTGLTSITVPNSVTSIGASAFSCCTGLTSVTIPDSVTSIGSEAFYNCTGLKSVTIPDSVTSIGNRTFHNCTGLTSVTIPDSVTRIGDNAFSGCIGLTSVTIPDSVTSIVDSAFYNCIGLTSVTIGNSVTRIGRSAFYNTGLYNDSTNWENGVLYIGNYLIKADSTISGKYLIKPGIKVLADYAFSGCTGLTSITIPDSVTSIGDYSFYDCDGLTSVTIPDSVTSIGDYSFYDCDGLTIVTIGNSVMNIGEDAFYNTGLYNNSSNRENGVLYIGNYLIKAESTISGDYSIKPGTKALADYAFQDCDGLTSVTIPDSVMNIGEDAFYDCDGLTSVTIPDSITSIGDGVFDWCSGLTSVTIPDSVTSIGYRSFYHCTGLTSVTIGNGVTSIGDYAFYECEGLTSVTIPDSVTSIGYRAFSCCTGLASVTIPNSVTSTGRYAFCDCTGLTSITIPNSVTSIGEGAFYECTRLTSVTIPDSVTSIGDKAFYGCTGLTSITIPDSVTSIGDKAFYGCTGLTSITIPDSVTSIDDGAFWNCTGLTSVTIGNNVTSIGDCAFYDCNNLSTTYYVGTPEQWRYISIGSYNYLNRDIIFECNSERPYYGKGACGDNLTWILYSDGELVIDGTGDMTDYSGGSNVPWYSTRSKIKSATILDGVTSIGDYAFYSCTGLTSVTIPDSVTSIGNYAFYSCTGLTSETIPDSVTSIGDYAFYGCTNLEKIEISAYSVEIADNAFDNSPKVILYCKSGSTVQSYAELNDIMYILIDGPASGFAVKNNQLVAYKGELENPQLPSGVTSIGANSFKDNSTVKTVELPNSVSSIYSGAFSNCTSLERIVVPHTVTTIAPDAFNGTNATIVCYANSYAHQYAVEKGMNVELISVTLNQTKVILSVGEYSIITATPEQEYLDSVQTSWKSSDTGVATVDANGKVTALSNGTATIYALAPTGETLATCSVQVGYSFRITIQNPSTKTISYKSGIILHATADNLPEGAKIVWEKDNDNFSMSDDGNGNCKIISKSNGSTTFTAKVKLADGSIAKDSNGNEISAQVTMNSKAGFFDKIVAFFKGLFGGNKVLPQLFKGIF